MDAGFQYNEYTMVVKRAGPTAARSDSYQSSILFVSFLPTRQTKTSSVLRHLSVEMQVLDSAKWLHLKGTPLAFASFAPNNNLPPCSPQNFQEV